MSSIAMSLSGTRKDKNTLVGQKRGNRNLGSVKVLKHLPYIQVSEETGGMVGGSGSPLQVP